MNMARFSWHALVRESRAGELRVLAAALIIAVTSITSVGFFTDRVRLAMSEQAAELLAADLVVSSTRPALREWEAQARAIGLQTARLANFPSVILAGEVPQLVDVKAVTDGYPLRGEVRVADKPYGAERPIQRIPERGTVWLDSRLTSSLGLARGAALRLGSKRFVASHVVAYEPDRGGDLIAFAPRLLMNEADLAATGLLGPGSRVSHRLLLAGSPDSLLRFRQWIEPRLASGEKVLDVRDARPELRSALERGEKFLGLAALVSVILAGVAISAAARRYSSRHLDGAAVMRCLGAEQNFITRLHLFKMFWLGLMASTAGCLIGFAAQEVLAQIQSGLFATQLPAPSWRPVAVGIATGLILLVGFALPSLARLKTVPPLRVLRRDLGAVPVSALGAYGTALAAVAALLMWQAADIRLTALVLAGSLVTVLTLAIVSLGMVRALRLLRGRVGVAWRYGLANISRRAQSSVAQILAFGLGIMVLLLLSIVRGDLIASWQDRLPPDAPNQFLINIQPDQVEAVHAFLKGREIGRAQLFPMIRARLVAINDRVVTGANYTDDRARRLVEREFNMSWAAGIQDDNRLVAGRWWSPDEHGKHLVSVEKGLAERLGLQTGDRLRWRIADRELTLTIASIRSVEWDSFRANFFVVAPPGVLDDFPATYMTGFHLPAPDRNFLSQLVRRFPNVTIIDVDAIMNKVRTIMDRVNLSVQYVFLFTLFAGLTVLYSAIQSTQDERLYESALLRTLGASRNHVLKGLLSEFAALGLLAGILAAVAASIAGLVLARQVFQLNYLINPWIWVIGLAGGAVGVALFGTIGARFVLNRPPLQSMKEI